MRAVCCSFASLLVVLGCGRSESREQDAAVTPDSGTPSDASLTDASAEPEDPHGTWRSALYPRGFLPIDEGGRADAEGRALQDYSYAGYHRGEVAPPFGEGTPARTVDAALGNGAANATSAIQTAIDDTCAAGGGVVRIPAGTYVVRLPTDASPEAIRIPCSHLVLRGDGPSETRIVFDDPLRARAKNVIGLRSSGGGVLDPAAGTAAHMLATSATGPTRTLTLADVAGLAVGDLVTVRNDVTAAFRAAHRMDAASTGEGDFWPASSFRGILYQRVVTAIEGDVITLDAPTRYPLLVRDAARVLEIATFIEESGVESLALGMVRNTTSSLTTGGEASHDDEYDTVGTTPYQVHASHAIRFDRVHDGWLYDVDSFEPSANAGTGIHVLSIGVEIASSSFRITVQDCDFGRPQYRGGGGNGYLMLVQGNDNLVAGSSTADARHGFILSGAVSGNVILRGRIIRSRYADDSHRFLAHANLFDAMVIDRGFLQSVNRGTTSTGAGFTGTEMVFWNPYVVQNHASLGNGCAVETSQLGHGYAIGSHAAAGQQARLCPDSFTNSYWATLDEGAPVDFTEGEGMGATLYPPSLYEHQRARRCVRQALACP